jgi:hypothetical protein
MKLTGETRSTRGWGNCPSATLSTKNPTLTDPGSNPGLRGERPANNRLSHGTAINALTGTRNTKCSLKTTLKSIANHRHSYPVRLFR